MMKTYRYRSVMFFLLMGLLLLMWALELGGVRTRTERERQAVRVLPSLIDVPEVDIRRVEIDRGGDHLAFERRGDGPGQWQMVEPKDVAAEPVRLDALVRNLKELRKDPDAGTIAVDSKKQGFDPPAATIRLFSKSSSPGQPIATLELGRAADIGSARRLRYARPSGATGTDLIDGRLVSAVDEPAIEWRQPNLMPAPTFQVKAVRIVRRDQPGGRTRPIRAERDASGRWTVELPTQTTAEAPRRGPQAVPADGPKVENLLAAMASLRVADPPRGYADDNAKDLAAFGLGDERATIRVEIEPARGEPMAIEIGKNVPGQPDRVYARQVGQDDVVIVDSRALTDIPADVNAIRSHQVTEIIPRDVVSFEVETHPDVFRVERSGRVWKLTSPKAEPADPQSVAEFLSHLQDLQTSEFLDPSKVVDPKLDPPVMRVKVRQASTRPDAEPYQALDLRLGRHDIARKAVYAQLEGDSVTLVLPDKVIEILPKNPLAFRDKSVADVKAAEIHRLVIRRGSRVDELVPETKGKPNAWRMIRPIEAQGDVPTITQTLSLLGSLRAKEFTGVGIDQSGASKAAGLDNPPMEIEWESDAPHRLRIGTVAPRTTTFYAVTDAEPMIFTLPAEVVRELDAEYHSHRVETFPPKRALRVVLHFFGRTVALKYRPPQKLGQVEWVPEADSDASGMDLSRIQALVQTMASLETRRFIQYEGPHPIDTGLSRPRLTIEVFVSGEESPRVLRIGAEAGDSNLCAATGSGPTGPAFLLPDASWNELIRIGERLPTLPEDIFAH